MRLTHPILDGGLTKSAIISRIAGGCVALLSLSVMTGWFTHNVSLIQVMPNFVAMQFNTALCFLLASIGVLALGQPRKWISRSCGIAATILAAITALQYMANIDIGIDQFFIDHYITTRVSHPGRMAPETALCFILSGTALTLLTFKVDNPLFKPAIELMGIITLALSGTAFAAYIAGDSYGFGIGGLTRMAVHTSAGFMTLSISILAMVWTFGQYRVKALYISAPFILCAFIVFFDLLSPNETAAGILYILLIVSSLLFKRVETPIIFAIVATFLTGLGYMASPIIAENSQTYLTNDILAMIAVWVTALVVYRHKKTQLNLSEKEERLASLVEGAMDGIISTTSTGIIEGFNPAAERIFGYSKKEIIGKNITRIIPSGFDAQADRGVAAQAVELEGRRKDASPIPLEMSVAEIQLRDKTMLNGIIRDISERRQADTRLQHAMQDLMESNEDLERFAYVASHDLKSPLRAIDNLSLWLEEDASPMMDDENKARLGKLRERVSRMEGLLNSLLAYSRSSAKNTPENKKLISAGALLTEVKALQDVPEGFTVTLDNSLDDIMISRMPLEQIFHNLLSNAIKHHDKDSGTVIISGLENEDSFQFYITDDGPGIDPKFHAKIFEMFQTLRPRDEVEGSGMGLALIKKMLRRHNGCVEVVSDVGHGSRFIVTWPK